MTNPRTSLLQVTDDDLLGRRPSVFPDELIQAAIKGCTVLITGAAGSIGSGLCRQIVKFQPTAIVGLDNAESPLFEIQQEMLSQFPHTPFHAVIGNIQNRGRMDEIFRKYSPLICYHAAAYKHVPLMEEHPFEAIENNVIGTHNVALAAAAHGTHTFVLISSDKAVRPTSIMGASKRIAELLLEQIDGGAMRRLAVRFGNVLGSTGSVLTIFRRQLAAGGPITVTDPQMRRFFMTVSEACHLVLQTSAIPGDDGIFILDMGEQINIVDLAHRLIRLSGLEPERDVPILFTGVRPGEKLYEELSHLYEDTLPTSHPEVRKVQRGPADPALQSNLHRLFLGCTHRNRQIVSEAIARLVQDYVPYNGAAAT